MLTGLRFDPRRDDSDVRPCEWSCTPIVVMALLWLCCIIQTRPASKSRARPTHYICDETKQKRSANRNREARRDGDGHLLP